MICWFGRRFSIGEKQKTTPHNIAPFAPIPCHMQSLAYVLKGHDKYFYNCG